MNDHQGRTLRLLQMSPPLAHAGHCFKVLGSECLYCVKCFKAFSRNQIPDLWCSGGALQLTSAVQPARDDLHWFRGLNYVPPGMATRKQQTADETATTPEISSRVPVTLDEKGRKVPDFGAPIPVSKEDLPPRSKRGGRISNVPAMQKWLDQLQPGEIYELGSQDEDGGHPLNRVTQLRKTAGEKFKVETSPLIVGKRYRVFVTKL